MSALLIVTHADFASGLLNAAESIIGAVSRAETVCISREDSPEAVKERIAGSLERLKAHEGGAVIMTDMFGGTPYNLSLSFLDSGLVEVITGVNLPMVLKFFSSRKSMATGDLANLLRDYGHDSIRLASDFLKK